MNNFAILNDHSLDVDIETRIISKLSCVSECSIRIFSNNAYAIEKIDAIKNACPNAKDIQFILIPSELDNYSKKHNFVLKTCRDAGIDFVHVLRDSIVIEQDPSTFVKDVQRLMETFDLKSWFNTITDGMNYVYAKYNPRLKIPINVDKYKKFGFDELVFTSHANINWTCYRLQNAKDEEIFLNEDFQMPMFFIIEFLARRRALSSNTTSLNFMNMYPTVQSEYKVFSNDGNFDVKLDSNKMQEDDKLFRSMNVNHLPDNSIDRVLETIYAIFNSKLV